MLSFSCNSLAFFLDTGAFTATFALEKQFGAAYATSLIQFDRFDVGGENGEGSFNTYTIRYLTYGESSSTACALTLNYVSTETLDTLFTTFNNLIVNGNVIASFKAREVFLPINCSCTN